jgi:hypothetical protein
MSLLLEQVQITEQEQVVNFLEEMFHAPPDALFLESDNVRWRYFDPRPDWIGSRSYVFRDEGQIVAHGCVVPDTYVRPNGEVIKGLFIIDWAARPTYPGYGLLLAREIGALADLRLGYGGSADARALVDKALSAKTRASSKERAIGEMWGFDRAIRPLAFLRDRSIPAWRAWARAGRAFYRNAMNPLKSVSAWKTRPVERFDPSPAATSPHASECGLILPFRSNELLNYMLDCPSVRFKGFLLEKEGVPRGHLLLAGRDSEVRVADLVIDSNHIEDWIACYCLAASAARKEFSSASRLRVAAPLDFQKKALLHIGFSEESRAQIFAQGRKSILTEGELPLLNMMDNDAAYLF